MVDVVQTAQCSDSMVHHEQQGQSATSTAVHSKKVRTPMVAGHPCCSCYRHCLQCQDVRADESKSCSTCLACSLTMKRTSTSALISKLTYSSVVLITLLSPSSSSCVKPARLVLVPNWVLKETSSFLELTCTACHIPVRGCAKLKHQGYSCRVCHSLHA